MRFYTALLLMGSAHAAVRISDNEKWTLNNTIYTSSIVFGPIEQNIQFLLYVNYKIQNCGMINFNGNLDCDFIGPLQSGVEFKLASNFVLNCTKGVPSQPFWCSIPKVYPCQDLGPEMPQIIIAPNLDGIVGGMISLYLCLFGVFFFTTRTVSPNNLH
jgi:hypothetical protein